MSVQIATLLSDLRRSDVRPNATSIAGIPIPCYIESNASVSRDLVGVIPGYKSACQTLGPMNFLTKAC